MKIRAGLALMLWALAAAAHGSVSNPGLVGRGNTGNTNQTKTTPSPWDNILNSIVNTVVSEARTVPDLKGKSPSAASATVSKAGLSPRLYPSPESQDPGARVYWQSPLANTSVTAGSVVTFAVATPGIAAPPSPTTPPVPTTSPPPPEASSPTPKTTTDSVVRPKSKTLVQVPDLHGETPLEARESLKQIGLKLGRLLDGEAPPGARVDHTDPAANSLAPRGTVVNYVFIVSPAPRPWGATLVVIVLGVIGGGALLGVQAKGKARERRFAQTARWRTDCSPPVGHFAKAPSPGGPTLNLTCLSPPCTALWVGLATAEIGPDD